jgi:polyphosphate glucokinase
MDILGIDVGASGIKGAVVDTTSGTLTTDRWRAATPEPSTPKAVARAVVRMAEHFSWSGPIGVGMPGPIRHGAVMTAINMHRSWVGTQAAEMYAEATGARVSVLNDADAAGLAEMRFGAGKGEQGVVVVFTFGTGIGSSVFIDGVLLPNTEFGQLEWKGKPAEKRAAARVRKEKALSWLAWGRRVDAYIRMVEELTWPDLFIVGGGVSRRSDRFLHLVHPVTARVLPAALRNDAGIVGAALYAREQG